MSSITAPTQARPPGRACRRRLDLSRKSRPGETVIKARPDGRPPCSRSPITVGILVALIRAGDRLLPRGPVRRLLRRPRARYARLPARSPAPSLITVIALLVAVPLGLGAAMYLSEYASRTGPQGAQADRRAARGRAVGGLRLLRRFFVTPTLLQDILDLEVNFTNALAAGLVLGVMIIPTVASLSEDALSAVPQALRQGSLAMGANRMQTTLRVVCPAALSGIAAAIVLGMSRAVGETMIVALAAGAQKNICLRPARGHADDDRLHRADRRRREPGRLDVVQQPLRGRPAAVRSSPSSSTSSASRSSVASGRSTDEHRHRHRPRGHDRDLATGKSQDRNVASLVFLGRCGSRCSSASWCCFVLIVDTAIDGRAPLRQRPDHQLHLARSGPEDAPASGPASSARSG